MAGPFLGISMASQALRNFQRAIDTAGHNIANVNTQGYSRQAVDFGTLPSLNFYSSGWKTVGQGSIVTNINRIRDAYLEKSYNNAQSQSSRYGTLADGLKKIDAIYGEPSDTGISQAMDRFFNSWSGLGSNPSGTAERAEVRLSGQVLTDRVRNRFADLNTLEANQQTQINSTIDQINGLGQRIAELNKQITTALAANGTPNDLMDQRDLAVTDLSKLVNVTQETFPDGSYAVYTAGFTLVQGGASRPLPKAYDPATQTITDGALTYNIRGGSLSGLMSGLNETRAQKANLDALANELRTQVNTLHMAGVNPAGDTGIAFFNDTLPQTGAVDIALSAEVQADPGAIASGMSGDAGDGSIARSLAELRDQSVVNLGTKSFSRYFSDIVTKVASDANYAGNAQETEQAVLAQVQNQRQAVSGVSIDDEMANLVKMQRSYQAAARALSLFDQVSEDLLSILRR